MAHVSNIISICFLYFLQEAVDGVMPPRSTKRPQSAPSPFEVRISVCQLISDYLP